MTLESTGGWIIWVRTDAVGGGGVTTGKGTGSSGVTAEIVTDTEKRTSVILVAYEKLLAQSVFGEFLFDSLDMNFKLQLSHMFCNTLCRNSHRTHDSDEDPG